MLKSFLHNHFWGKYLLSEYHALKSKILPKLMPDKIAVKRYFKRGMKRELDLSNPVTFSEKLNWYKLNARKPLMQQCADKYEVRKYVTECGYGDCLNELYGIFNRVKDIRPEDLPDSFVLKAAHGSHMNIVVKDKSKLNWRQTKMMLNSWLHQDIYWAGREWVYKDMPRRIIAEKYLEDRTGELRDYKFFCYHGVPCFFEYDGERLTGNHFRNYYKIDGTLLPVHDDVPNRELDYFPVEKQNYQRMIEMAKVLSKPFQFARVDLYLIEDKILFGELTFFDNGGNQWFDPIEYDRVFGEPWVLEY